ncbi:hypothetical protein J7E49_06170 [Variovorax paradoxus]|nr:hypothetical protein [Variovorax paradoxus]
MFGICPFGCKTEKQGGLSVKLSVLPSMRAVANIECRERRIGFLFDQCARGVVVKNRQVHCWIKKRETNCAVTV